MSRQKFKIRKYIFIFTTEVTLPLFYWGRTNHFHVIHTWLQERCSSASLVFSGLEINFPFLSPSLFCASETRKALRQSARSFVLNPNSWVKMKAKTHRTAKTICGVCLYNLWCEFIERSKEKSKKWLRHRECLAISPEPWVPWLTGRTDLNKALAFPGLRGCDCEMGGLARWLTAKFPFSFKIPRAIN